MRKSFLSLGLLTTSPVFILTVRASRWPSHDFFFLGISRHLRLVDFFPLHHTANNSAATGGANEPASVMFFSKKSSTGNGGRALGYGVDVLVRPKENYMICIPKESWELHLEKALQEPREEAGQNKQDLSKYS